MNYTDESALANPTGLESYLTRVEVACAVLGPVHKFMAFKSSDSEKQCGSQHSIAWHK